MAKKHTIEELKEINKLLIERIKNESIIGDTLGEYLTGIREAKALQQSILQIKATQASIEDDAVKAGRQMNDEEQTMVDLLKVQTKEQERHLRILGKKLKAVNKTHIALSKVGAAAVKGFAKLPDFIDKNYKRLQGSGLFDMDKSMKSAALQMGVLSKQTDGFRGSIKTAALSTTEIGIGINELAEIQANYSEEIGRTVMLTEAGLKAMGQMAAATMLGAQGSAQMAAELETQGLSAERTRDFVEQTMNDSHKMGLNASKVVKNIQGNIKLLNRYNFKGGVKGLAKMAQTVTKLGVGMEFVSGMADKLFDIDGAVEMSAQLQVMGGAWAGMADPFKLMFQARNDMEGLVETMGRAAESAVHFNAENGEFEITGLELHRLRKIAETTGVAYDDLATAAKKAAKLTRIKSEMNITIGDEDLQNFIASTSEFQNGKGVIQIEGKPKLLKHLTNADKSLLRARMEETKTLKERAKSARTFDDTLKNTMNLFKTLLLPMLESMNEGLIPKVDELVKEFKDSGWADKLSDFAKGAGKFIATVGGWMIQNPWITGISLILADKAQWIANGFLLAKGFQMGNAGGGMMGNVVKGGGFKSNLKGASMGGMAIGAGLLSALVGGVTEYFENKDTGMSTGEQTGRVVSRAGGAGLGAWGGAAAGAALGAFGGPAGIVIGGLIGAALGAWGGDILGEGIGDAIYGDEKTNRPFNDGVFEGGRTRGIAQGGKITPIDNKDDLVAFKPNGPIDDAIRGKKKKETIMKIEFGEIKFKFDDLMVVSPGSPKVAIDLLENPQFIRNITSMIHSETERIVKGAMTS